MTKITISVIKCDVGGFVGHSSSHPEILKLATEEMNKARNQKKIIDFRVMSCGDDLELIMTHKKFIEDPEIHKLAWDIFVKCTKKAEELKLYGAGQDLLKHTFSGNVKGMGPGVAEMCFEERKSEPILVFMADKTSPGAWNLPLFKIFGDPMSTPGLVIDNAMHRGFSFTVHDIKEHKKVTLSLPNEAYYLLGFIGQPGRYLIKSITRNSDNEIAAVTSTQKLSLIAGKYVGKDDPVMIVRAQSGFPAVGEVLDPFAFPHLVEGWMRGSHYGPLMPVSFKQATPSRFDGPPRVICAGFQLVNGKLIGPRNMFDDPSFDKARNKANKIADYMRQHGPFEPHRLNEEALEYTTLPEVLRELKNRIEPID